MYLYRTKKMKEKITFLKTAITLGCLLLCLSLTNRLNAQIIYTDIPDATPNATYALDLNNDTIIDFLIQFDMINKVMCKPQNSNAYSGKLVSGLYLPWALSASTLICDSLATWYDSNNVGTMASGSNIGNWVGVSNSYLALKIMVGSNTYFGWARIDINANSTSFTIKDYAYQSSPNTCIKAGQTILGYHEISNKKQLSIFPNPSNESTNIQILGNPKNATLTLYNAMGQVVKEIHNISEQNVSLPRENLPSGWYLLRLTDENETFELKKLLITN